jgi:hypothetical protein
MTAVIAAPLRVEQAALRHARTPVIHTGMGPRRSRNAAERLGGAVVVAGVGGGLTAEVRVGDVVVATEVRGSSTVACPSAPILAAALRGSGLRVYCGPIASSPTLVRGNERRRWGDAFAVDMESAWLAPVGGSPFAVVRAISDRVGSPLARPGIVADGWVALRSLRAAVPALDAWAAAIRPREILLASTDGTEETIDMLRRRFPAVGGPARDLLSDAATNRQRAFAHDCDLVLVAGSATSYDALQLVEAAQCHGTPARLVEDAADIPLDDLAKAARVGLIAEASAPPRLVGSLIDALAGLGPLTVRGHDSTADSPQNTRPKEVN